jgi:tetratricopeptide (TPR) repeat protein
MGHFAAATSLLLNALHTLTPADHRERALVLLELGHAYASADELIKAEQAYTESFGIYKQLSDNVQTTTTLRALGAIYSAQGRHDDAVRVLQKALKLSRTQRAIRLEAQVLDIIGVAYYRQGKTSKASDFFNQALKLVSESGVQFDLSDLSELLNNLGNAYIGQQKYQEAEPLLARALALLEQDVGPSHPDLVFSIASLALVYRETHRLSEAEGQYLRALNILQPSGSEFAIRVASLLHGLSITYAKAGRKTEATATLARAASIAHENIDQHPELTAIIEDYAVSLKQQGRSREAEELQAESRRARLGSSLVIRAHRPF